MSYRYICKVDGQWSNWSEYTECTTTCGGGEQNRNRSCTNPVPQYDGRNCTGQEVDIRNCSEHPCPGEFFSFFILLPIFTCIFMTKKSPAMSMAN